MTKDKPRYTATDRVSTHDGRHGMVLQEVKNLFLMRPGRVYLVEFDGGEKEEIREEDLTP